MKYLYCRVSADALALVGAVLVEADLAEVIAVAFPGPGKAIFPTTLDLREQPPELPSRRTAM
jgi:hypothetical protein